MARRRLAVACALVASVLASAGCGSSQGSGCVTNAAQERLCGDQANLTCVVTPSATRLCGWDADQWCHETDADRTAKNKAAISKVVAGNGKLEMAPLTMGCAQVEAMMGTVDRAGS